MALSFVMSELEKLGTEQTAAMWRKHGAKGDVFGVNIGKMKQLIKKLKLQKNTKLAKELFNTGNNDAMYLAGLIVEPKELDIETLKQWVEHSTWQGISESIIPWCAAEAGLGFELATYCLTFEDEEHLSIAYATLGNYVIVKPDELLDIPYFSSLLDTIKATIHSAANRVKYAMNACIIAIGTSCAPLYDKALLIADEIGLVEVDMYGTACKVPDAVSYIQNTVDRKGKGHKRKKVRC